MDNKELVAGTTLYLPIHVDGALFSVGDGHGVQGDGEVCVTAIETGLIGTFDNVGAEAVAHAAPDGYTLLSISSPNAINATLYDNLNFNFIHDITPVASVIRVPLVMEVNLSVPVDTVPEFIAYGKANPGKISFASGGVGTPQHVSAELFMMLTGISMVHVPYRGSAPALMDLMGGQVQAMFDTTPASMAYIRAGKVRPLAVTTATRADVLPDLPTVADSSNPAGSVPTRRRRRRRRVRRQGAAPDRPARAWWRARAGCA